MCLVNGAFAPVLKCKWSTCDAPIDHHLPSVFLDDKQQRLIDDFAMVEDPHERLSVVIERSRKQAPLPTPMRSDANRVHGCVSVVWLVGEVHEGRCHFRSDAESPMVRGLVAFLCDFFTGAPVAEVAASTLEPLDTLALTQNLSPTRRNGLVAVRQAIRGFAQGSLNASERA